MRGPLGVALGLLLAASLALSGWYGSFGLSAARYWDERFSVDNVRALLLGGSLRPANGYYQSLSYLPQTALLAAVGAVGRWSGSDALEAFDGRGRFTPTGYLASRLLEAVFGCGCLLLVFLLGRRLFSPEIGLLGAFLLFATPWLVQAASMFKPDVLLALTVLLTVAWSLRALERPTLPRFALAGCGVALALSTKLTGGLAAVPLALAAGLSVGTWRQRAGRLLAGGAAALALFALLNPYFLLYRRYLTLNLEIYSRKAGTYGGTHLGVWREELGFLLSSGTHGWALGALGLAAAVAFAVTLVRSRADRRRRVEGVVLLAFPVAYSLAYAAVTPHFKGNNFLVILPFSSLLAAWGLARIWAAAGARLPLLGRPWAWAPPTLVLVAALAPAPMLYAYREALPSTADLAASFFAHRFGGRRSDVHRRVYVEEEATAADRAVAAAAGRVGIDLSPVPRLDALPRGVLDAADGEVFLAGRLSGEGADFFWRRISRADRASVRRFAPRPFRAWGPALVGIAHPRREVEAPAAEAGAAADTAAR
jgi:Dolichyl-phosphate-mannose-protein mannosyltransferase